jgi:ppGpp synthetase/RelA/SpoT-type nucleotidyltranferase
MADDRTSNILAEYDRQKSQYEDFAQRCESLLRELLNVEGYRVHSVTSRLKKRAKLEEKLNREGKHYECLSEVTDTAGVRVITHFEDDVDRVGTLVEREFTIDRERSVDKRRVLDPDRFGYLSLHYVCTLHPGRQKLAENCRYDGLLCEIQIRSILQHAWAEIEHDLGYKPNTTVPAPIRRRFSRLAGLLEIADQEFESIRNELANYAARVEEEMKTEPSQVEIDDVSVAAFYRADGLCRELDEAMARQLNLNIEPPALDAQRLADELRYVGLLTMSDLRGELEANRDLILCQFAKRVGELPPGTRALSRGLCLLHFIQVKLARIGLPAMVDFYKKFNFKETDRSVEETVESVISAVQSCS